MSFVLSALGLGRRLSEQRFTETVTFFTVARDEDPVTLQPVDVETVVAAGVRARLKVTSAVVSERQVAGQAPAVMQRELHVPVGSVAVGPSVFVRVTGSTADPGMVGRVFRTVMRSGVGQVTAWRYPVEEVS